MYIFIYTYVYKTAFYIKLGLIPFINISGYFSFKIIINF